MSKSVNANIISRDTATHALRDRADHVAGRLALVANAKRLLILCELTKGERSVGALQQAVGLSQSALSQHLAKLREAGMVDTRRKSQTIFYRISDPDLEILMAALYDAFCKDLESPTEPALG
ncbi:ArsR/SmtB family transcription factor [Paracoccus shandongensis]|uniref:ArsR/SmtB family transcription factor n=1 Tax=Paracoccus shandongensis TaxID=2816048 RepID=UPI001A8F22B6|nr:metalloregulator ArsR/SmtB family transcription factor [Paracoccus shandongensis]